MKTTKTARVQGGERKLVMMIILYLISLCSAENAKEAKNYGRELKVRMIFYFSKSKKNT